MCSDYSSIHSLPVTIPRGLTSNRICLQQAAVVPKGQQVGNRHSDRNDLKDPFLYIILVLTAFTLLFEWINNLSFTILTSRFLYAVSIIQI